MNKKAILLLSGGIDSATVLGLIAKEHYEVYALSFCYEQRHKVELNKACDFIKDYDVIEHKIINIDLGVFGGSALTDDTITVPTYKNSSDLGEEIPVTYVPARNTIFLSYALAYAETRGANDIFLGIHAEDYANYPDCRPEYLEAFEKMARLATSMGVKGQEINIHAPIINMSKAEIIEKGTEIGVDYSKTISCYNPTELGLSCGACHSCLLRKEAFEKNNIIDPTRYVNR